MPYAQISILSFSVIQSLWLLLRLLCAGVCGAAIGFERTRRLKEAGIRTHIIVCSTAALFMIVSKYAFFDLDGTSLGTRGADPSRIAAQVVSGISFLCAGVIFRNGSSLKGLTTAAGLWATAAIGLTFGAGMYVLGLCCTVFITVLQIITHRFTFGSDSLSSQAVCLHAFSTPEFDAALWDFVRSAGGMVDDCKIIRKRDEPAVFQFTLRAKILISDDQWNSFMHQHPEVQYLEHEASV